MRSQAMVMLGVAAALAAAGPCSADPAGEIALRLRPLVGVTTAAARVEVEWTAPPGAAGEVTALSFDRGSRTVSGQIGGQNGGEAGPRSFAGRVRVPAPVPAPAHAMRTGDAFTADDLTTVELDLLALRADAVLEPQAIIDRTARRGLEPGRPILARDLKAPLAITRNDLVTIEARSGQILVRAQAKALDDGGVGQLIRVQNLDSRKVITGTVRGRGQVDIASAMP